MSRRSLVFVAASYFVALWIAFQIEAFPVLVIGVVCLCFGVLSFLFRRYRGMQSVMLILFSCAVACGSVYLLEVSKIKPTRQLIGVTTTITGEVTDVSRENGISYAKQIRVEDCMIEGAPQSFLVTVYARTPIAAQISDRITCEVLFQPIEDTIVFSARDYYAARGIYVSAYVTNEAQITPQEGIQSVASFFARQRAALSDTLHTMLKDANSGIVTAMLLGERDDLADEVSTSFARSGISHILAISGTHILLLCALLYALLKRLPIGYTMRNLLCLILAPCYCMLVGSPFSAIRATIMAMIYFGARIVDRQSDGIRSLSIAVLVMIGFSPALVLDLSFQLSVFATAAVIFYGYTIRIVVHQWMAKYQMHPWLVRLADAIGISLCVTFFTYPMIAASYGRVSLLAPITNIFAMPLTTVLLGLSALFCAAVAIPFLSFLQPVLVDPIRIVTAALFEISNLFAEIPFSYPAVTQAYLYVWYFGSILLLIIAFFLRKRKNLWCHAALLSVIILLCGVLSYQLMSRNRVQVMSLDEKNPSNMILLYQSRAVLIGAGTNAMQASITADYLKSIGVDQIDVLVSPRENIQSTRAVKRLASEMEIDLLVGDTTLYDERFSNQMVQFESMELSVWDQLEIEIRSFGDSSEVILTIQGKTIGVRNGKVMTPTQTPMDLIFLSENADTNSLPIRAGGAVIAPIGKQLTLPAADFSKISVSKEDGLLFRYRMNEPIMMKGGKRA